MTSATFSPRARRDVVEAVRWIGRDNRSAARRLRARIVETAIELAEFPELGARRPDVLPVHFRAIALRGFPYLVIYDANVRPPRVVRVLHGARDMADLLRGL